MHTIPSVRLSHRVLVPGFEETFLCVQGQDFRFFPSALRACVSGKRRKTAAAALLGSRGSVLAAQRQGLVKPSDPGGACPTSKGHMGHASPHLPTAERVSQGCGLLHAGRLPPVYSELGEARDMGPDAWLSLRVGLGEGRCPGRGGPASQ